MHFSVGALVSARGREWVVLPESRLEQDLLVLQPLGGSSDEVTGIYLPLEPVTSADFALPDPTRDLGSHDDGMLLREAVRLGFRAAAGPFRCLARIAVEPRPYQLVPLLMALRQDPVRLLIADDVGIGKTVEALLIARELLDRGEIERMAILCPPHLAEQWHRTMQQQFHLDATLVLPSTARALERDLPPGDSLFERHPYVVVSTDWIKSERRRHEFLRVCPELVIVDEAHTCTSGQGVDRASQQRHDLLRALTEDPTRHLVLVSATPHSGKQENFRSLLTLLQRDLANLPEELSGEANRRHRETLARYLVQRRRGDLKAYLNVDTPFPLREQAEEQFTLSKTYKAFLLKVLSWCREQVEDPKLERRHQRVRWWSAMALLRAIGSSPSAAAATLRNRAASAETDSAEEADLVGRRLVMDLNDESAEGSDVVPGAQAEDDSSPDSERLRRLALEAEALEGAADHKLKKALEIVAQLVEEGWSPILFCRFIPTVHYLATHLRKALPNEVKILAITGDLPPEERESRVQAAREHSRRVLVCTDCLSEGVNLQDGFDAVVHYDLAWNPTRHEQREGRVDRFGQPNPRVRTLTFYGRDNPVDGLILDVLLRRHRTIHKQLGITVPVPGDTQAVVEAMMEALLLQGKNDAQQDQLTFSFVTPQQQRLQLEWQEAVDREKLSRTLFAQASIPVAEVAAELDATRAALGGSLELARFVTRSLQRLGAHVEAGASPGTPTKISVVGCPMSLREGMGLERSTVDLRVTFQHSAPHGSLLLTRTHPMVRGLAAYVMEAALEPIAELGTRSPARRCGATFTHAVSERTTLLLLRLRFHILARQVDGNIRELLAEEALLVAFTGPPASPSWLTEAQAEALLDVEPSANMGDDQKRHMLSRILNQAQALNPHLEDLARTRGKALLEAHRRVRKAGGLAVRGLDVQPHLPVDVLGVYLLMPGGTP